MINWYPGHMAKSIRKINEQKKLVDLFVIVLDARVPLSSYNFDFDSIAPSKPRLFIIAKSDLGDQQKLPKILTQFSKQNKTVLCLDLKNNKNRQKIIKKMQFLFKNKKEQELRKGLIKPRLRAFVVGVPNAGKSTLINLLSKSKKALTGNYPGVTRNQQWIKVEDFEVMDTPGILWPKFENQLTAIKLAAIGTIKKEIIPPNDFFVEGYKLLSKYYPQKLVDLNLIPSYNLNEIFTNKVELCKERNFVLQDKKWDLQKANNFLINYLKNLKNVTFDN